jgi:ribonuclease P protein component
LETHVIKKTVRLRGKTYSVDYPTISKKGVYLITKDQRLHRSKRLRSSENFKRIFQQGIKIRQGCLTTYTKPNKLGYARLGLAVTKKAIPKAASRNWVKRVIREQFRLNQTIISNLDIIVVVTTSCFSDKQVLLHDLNKQWSSLAIYYKKA